MNTWPHIAIPSYQRPGILAEKTLPTLLNLGVPYSQITIFVADGAEADRYRDTLDPIFRHRIEVALPGMGNVRRHIQHYYENDERVLNVDDDISGFYVKRHDKLYTEITPEEFHTMIHLGFWSCEEQDCRLWGIYPVLNPLFMKKRVRVGLVYIVGAFWGCINSQEARYSVTLDDKEDFERTIKHFLADGAVVRLEAYSLKTAYYTTPGGMQVDRTPERIKESAEILANRYPLLCKLNPKKASGRMEVRLIDPKRRMKVLT